MRSAAKPIPVFEEITLHYNASEYDLAEPFECRCASTRCMGQIRSFKYLSASQRQHLRPLLADYFCSRLEEGVA